MQHTKIDWGLKNFYTWNPITGCTFGCEYCYARKIAMRFSGHFKPTFLKDRLEDPSKLKKPANIFVCSMGEIYDPKVKKEWRVEVWKAIERAMWHRYYILTKQPQNIIQEELPKNIWIGVSITKKEDLWRIQKLKDICNIKRFVSFEPLLERIY